MIDKPYDIYHGLVLAKNESWIKWWESNRFVDNKKIDSTSV
jgi:hypothetical protein